MTQLTTTKRICEHLEKYVFDRVWNQPYTQFRSYIRPILLNSVRMNASGDSIVDIKPTAGFYSGGKCCVGHGARFSNILLPPHNSNDELMDWLPKASPKFFVYAVPAEYFGSTKLNVRKWTLFSRFCTNNYIDLQLFTDDGIVLNRNFIYIMQSDNNDYMLVAVESNMFLKMVGSSRRANSVIFGSYCDSDGIADDLIAGGKLNGLQVPKYLSEESLKNIVLRTSYDGTMRLSDASYVIYNGRLCTGSYWTQLKVNGYIEAVIDDDIVGSFSVDAWSNDAPVYTDSVDEYGVEQDVSSERLLIHIPKSINPNYFLITPDTCDVWLVPLEGGRRDPRVNGVYLYPCKGKVHQITHNDFSIDYDLIKDIAEAEGFTKYEVKVFVRLHGRKSVFIRDANYIDFLYNLDDSEIIDFLLGRHNWQTDKSKLLFWSADHLEDCKYADALLRKRCKELDIINSDKEACKRDAYDRDASPVAQCECCGLKHICPYQGLSGETPEVKDHFCPYYSSRSIQDYIDILGYFHVLALIGKRVWHFRATNNGVKSVVVCTPLALNAPEMEAEEFYPVVYLNGIRIPQNEITFNKTTATNVGVREVGHSDDILSSADIIPMNYSARLRVVLLPVYIEPDHQVFSKNYVYFKRVNTDDPEVFEYRKAIIIDEDKFSSLTPDEKTVVDGFYGERLSSKDRTFYIEKNNVKIGDTISVEVFDNRTSGTLRTLDMPGDASAVVTIQMRTYDQWRIFVVNEVTHIGGESGYEYTRIQEPGFFDRETKVLTLNEGVVASTSKILVFEGPRVFEDSIGVAIESGGMTFNPDGTKTFSPGTTGFIGKGFFDSLTDKKKGIPLDSDVVFMNGKRLIPNLDYVSVSEEDLRIRDTSLYCQNVSYLKENNNIDVIRTNTFTINQQKGFLIGDNITWEGQAPVWFDELSTLVIDGVLCSHYKQIMGKISLDGCSHRNGAPYEIKTSVSSLIKSMMDYDVAMYTDIDRISDVREFFGEELNVPMMRTIIPHSHRLYSVFLEEIVHKYLTTKWDFRRLSECSSKTEYLNQFSEFDYLRERDVMLRTHEPLSLYDYGFVDSFAIYHPLVAEYREDYDKLRELAEIVLPEDPIKHKDVMK